MKVNSLILFVGLLHPLVVGGVPDISMDIARFKTSYGTYLEISLYIDGASLACDATQGRIHGISYTLMIRDEENQIVTGDRFQLTRMGCPADDLIDVRRFSVAPGQYVIDLEAYDVLDTSQQITISQQFTIDAVTHKPGLSDLQLMSVIRPDAGEESALTKSGLYMEPLPFGLYYPALDQLLIYLETYDTESLSGQAYLQYTIRPTKGDIPVPVVTYKKVRKDPIAAQVLQLDISQLISGPYTVEAALYDGDKQIIAARKALFSRYNPKGDSIFMETSMMQLDLGFVQSIPLDSLDYALKAMAPIVSSQEVDIMNALLQKGNEKSKRFFIHRYWTQQSGKLAGPAYHSYMKVARVVDASYRSGFGFGFETDRGHIFLKYGKPDDIIEVEDEPSAPPYEIWFYNHFPATRQANVRFLFYNPSLTRNGHRLLHATAIGEIRNDRWEIELYRDATLETPGVNERVMGDNVHRNARRYFEY